MSCDMKNNKIDVSETPKRMRQSRYNSDPVSESFANIFKVKTLVTFAAVAVWAWLAIGGTISPDSVDRAFFVIISFFFGSQYGKFGKE